MKAFLLPDTPHKTKLSTKCNVQDRSLLQYTETNTPFSAVLYILRQVFIISQVICIAFHYLLAFLHTIFNTVFFSGRIFGHGVLKSKDSLLCCNQVSFNRSHSWLDALGEVQTVWGRPEPDSNTGYTLQSKPKVRAAVLSQLIHAWLAMASILRSFP